MYLYCYRRRPNFGDALNDVVWQRFIDVRLDREPGSDEVFVGIGTLLNQHLPEARKLHIFGSGLGYGRVAPERMRNWEVHFVRGPLTATALSLDTGLAISDPAILLNRIVDLGGRRDIPCSFMPHHSMDSPRFRAVCEDIGINYISPELPCDEVLAQLLRSEKLICSAMHGAITAEALRIPWLPVTHEGILESKWHDWAASLELDVEFVRLPAIYPEVSASFRGRLVGHAKKVICQRQLAHLAKSGRFQLGSEKILDDRLRRIEDKIASFNMRFG